MHSRRGTAGDRDSNPDIDPDIDRGFTLIELLIVIVILGVLATVVVFAVGGVVDRGHVSALAADERTIETAEESHYAIHGTYASEDVLVTAGFMRDRSNLHDVTIAPDGSSYSVDVTSSGGGGVTTVAAAPPTPPAPPPPTTAPAPTTPPTTVPAVPTGYAGFSGQATGTGSRTLVIIGNGGASTHALYSMLTTTPLPDTQVIWLDGSDVNDTLDVDIVIAFHPTYMVAADSVPIAQLSYPFGTTFVGQYMSTRTSNFWWTHQQGNPTFDQLLSHL